MTKAKTFKESFEKYQFWVILLLGSLMVYMIVKYRWLGINT